MDGGGPKWTLEVAAPDHTHLEKQDINIEIRRFNAKNNTVELTDRLRNAKPIKMDVEKIAPYVTNLKLPFDEAEDQPSNNE